MFEIGRVTLDHHSFRHWVILDGDHKPGESNGAIGEKNMVATGEYS
jgi:hypothetical protein